MGDRPFHLSDRPFRVGDDLVSDLVFPRSPTPAAEPLNLPPKSSLVQIPH